MSVSAAILDQIVISIDLEKLEGLEKLEQVNVPPFTRIISIYTLSEDQKASETGPV